MLSVLYRIPQSQCWRATSPWADPAAVTDHRDTLHISGYHLAISIDRHYRRIVMATQLSPATSASFHATAYLDLADTEVDPRATVSWKIDNEAVATVADHGSTGGVGACTVTGVADGTATLTAVATDADGHSVDSLTWPIAVAVVITQDA
jgi:hypothetical protein